jgi:hypothetical protein
MSEIINPNQLFKTLILKPDGQIKNLWDIQAEVLDIYHAKLKDAKRVAIELPTGSGKSIISLLILEMWRRIGKRVAILTSSIALGDDMKRRCDDLGIPNVVIIGAERAGRGGEEESRERVRNIKEYKRGNAIGIMNYWAYMKGKGIASPDVLVIDDADGFENLLIDEFSVVVRKDSDPDIYIQVMKELLKYRIYQRLETFESLVGSEDIQLIYFPHSIDMASRVRKIASSIGRSGLSDDLYWSLGRNGDAMHTYLMFVSGREITFTPYIITGSMHERIRSIPHVIYTSATLGTAERIHRTMGCFDEIVILAEKDIKSQVGTMGTRVIFPLSDACTTGRIDAKVLDAIHSILNTFKKILVLCNSHFDADKVIKYLQENGQKATLYQGEADSTHFATTEREGALVTAGRFIGLDLSSETCGVGVMTRMPYILGPVDLLIKNILEDAQYSDEKVSHRLVQGFGRCNRNPNDQAIYFMLDSRLASDILGEERIYQHFPRRMKAELDFGQEFAEIGGFTKTLDVGQQILNNKFPDIAKELADRSSKVSDKRLPVFQKPYLEEIHGWHDLTERRSYLEAAERFNNCIKHYEKLKGTSQAVDRQVAWLNYVMAKCLYLSYIFFENDKYKDEAIKHLELAMKSGYTSWFSGLQVVINELKQEKEREETIFNIEVQSFKESLLRKWNDFYSANSIGKRNPFETWEKMRQTLTTGSHDSICDTLADVLELMGFEVTVIKRAQAKPDLLVFSNIGKRYLSIVEVKAKEKSDVLKTEDVDQIGGHKTHYQSKYPDRPVYPLIFTDKGDLAKEAVEKAKGNVRVLRSSEFTTFMSKYVELMEKGWKIEEPTERLSFMERIPSPEKFEKIFKSSNEPLVSLDELLSIL